MSALRLREPLFAEDYLTTDAELHVGDLVMVEAGGWLGRGGGAEAEAAAARLQARAALPQSRSARHRAESAEWRARRVLEVQGGRDVPEARPGRGLVMKIVDVEMEPARRRVTVFFNAEERVDFRDLVRDLAHELHARIEMRQIGARDTTKLMDGIGPCGRQLCCSSHLKKFDPISVKMAKAQDMPLTDSRLLGNCGRLKCCLLYEFSTYEELR